jgi:hypothetical protein
MLAADMLGTALSAAYCASARATAADTKQASHIRRGSDYRGHPARPAPNNKRNRDSGVSPPGPRTTATAMTPNSKSSVGPTHSQLDAHGSTDRCRRLSAALCIASACFQCLCPALSLRSSHCASIVSHYAALSLRSSHCASIQRLNQRLNTLRPESV